MREYILIADKDKDTEFQYYDFKDGNGKALCYLKHNRFRVHSIRWIKALEINSTKLVRKMYYDRIYSREIGDSLKNKNISSNSAVFILTGRVYEKYGTSLINYLKDRYQNCILVLYIADMMYSMLFSIDQAKTDFNFIFSFDKRDAERYQINFLLEPFSTELLYRLPNINEPEFDITFVGHAKNRYDRIIKIYESLRQRGMKCDFHITGVSKSKQLYRNEINYGWVDFEELLVNVKKSKCVLEMVQNEEYSATTRYSEAMLLGKNLLTDCPVFKNPENRDQNIFYFNSDGDIPYDRLLDDIYIDIQKYRDMFSINAFINSIETVINKSS